MSSQWQGGDLRATFLADERIALEGSVATSALWSLASVPAEQARQIIDGSTPWQGEVTLTPSPVVTLQSRLLGVTSELPEPFAKRSEEAWPLQLRAELASGRTSVELADKLVAKVHSLEGGAQAGQVALGSAVSRSGWSRQPGWRLDAGLDTLDPLAWQAALAPLMSGNLENASSRGDRSPFDVRLRTECLMYRETCLGAMTASGTIEPRRAALTLNGDVLNGRVDYQPASERPLDIAITTLTLDPLFDLPRQHPRCQRRCSRLLDRGGRYPVRRSRANPRRLGGAA